jgi:hypothetical protein
MIQRKLLIMNGLYSMVLLGGDLKPILGLWFQLLSMALPREIAVEAKISKVRRRKAKPLLNHQGPAELFGFRR